MKEKINKELGRLQDDLMALENAVKQIEKAGEISTTVVDAAKSIQEKFAEHLQEVMFSFNDFLSKSKAHTEDNISELTRSHLKQIEEFNNVLDEYEQLSKQTRVLTGKIDSIDLPERFAKLENFLQQINTGINQIDFQNKKKAEKQDQELNRVAENIAQQMEDTKKQTGLVEVKIQDAITENSQRITELLNKQNRRIKSLRNWMYFLLFLFVLILILGLSYFLGLFNTLEIINGN